MERGIGIYPFFRIYILTRERTGIKTDDDKNCNFFVTIFVISMKKMGDFRTILTE